MFYVRLLARLILPPVRARALETFERDPLQHPDIARMNERQRADLPFNPEKVRPV